ncbi:MAG: phosphoglucosamine mutase, partial [Candidatus Bilamarchaeaceae archaeon]
MFGTSGIRGLYGSEITPELALRIGNAFAYSTITVGRDTRETGELLANAVLSGAMGAGNDAICCGIVPTPVLAFATLKHRANGIMVTASHNPPEYNGLKLISKGKEIGKEEEKKVLANYEKGISLSPWDKTGALLKDEAIIGDYMEFILPLVDAESIRACAPKVVVDCNGAARFATPRFLEGLGCKVIAMNTQPRGFARPSEPSAKNIEGLCAKVKAEKADFGIAHDGDGDRISLVDERGYVINMDVQLSLMILNELEQKKGKVVSTVESSLIVKDAVAQGGGELLITPVGSTYVGDKLEETGAVFGGEPAGEYVYPKGVHVPDAILAAAKFAEMFARKGKFSSLSAPFRPFPMVREKYKTPDKKKAMEKIRAGMDFEGKLNEVDGLRIDAEDYWLLIRPSGTEHIIRLTLEAKEQKKLEEIHRIESEKYEQK